MSDTNRSSSPGRTKALPAFVLIVAFLLGAGCIGPSPATPGPGPGAAVPSTPPPGPSTEACSFDRMNGDTGEHFLRGDSCYFQAHTPMDFLHELRAHPDQPVMVLDVPEGWITFWQAELLMREIDSPEPAAPVVSPLSSYFPFNQTSTIGTEALFLLEGYRAGRYPPALSSLYYFRPDRDGVRSWWDTWGRWGFTDEPEAIRMVQETYPDLASYASDWSLRSARMERADGGMYIAFIQEGSGIPILSARCYYVGDNRTVFETGRVNRSIMVLPMDFSPVRCGL